MGDFLICRKRAEPAGAGDPAPPPGDEEELPPDHHLPGGVGPALRPPGPGPLHPAHPLPRTLWTESISFRCAAALPHHTGDVRKEFRLEMFNKEFGHMWSNG